MSSWINRAVYQLSRDGTTSSTVDPTSATGLVSGATFTPTSGSLLVCIFEGSVTSTTPTGWTLPTGGSAVNATGLYVWWRVAASGSNAFATTHNGSNYPVSFAVYEFPSGSTFVKSVSAVGVTYNTGANPTINGLTGTNVLFGVAAEDLPSTGQSDSYTWSGTPTPVKDFDVYAPDAGTDGYGWSAAIADAATVSSWTPTGAASSTGSGSGKETLTFAVQASSAGASYPATVSFTDTATIADSPAVARPVSVGFASTASPVGGAQVRHVGTTTVTGDATLNTVAHAARPSSMPLASQSVATFTPTYQSGSTAYPSIVTVNVAATLNVSAHVSHGAVDDVTSAASVSAAPTVRHAGSVNVTSSTTFDAAPVRETAMLASLVSTVTLTFTPGILAGGYPTWPDVGTLTGSAPVRTLTGVGPLQTLTGAGLSLTLTGRA